MPAYSADWLMRSLKKPMAWSSSSGMMALYIPMHPSSKMPRIAFFFANSSATERQRAPRFPTPAMHAGASHEKNREPRDRHAATP